MYSYIIRYVCGYSSVFVVRRKRGSTKFSPTFELVTELPAAHEYFSIETSLMMKTNDVVRENGGDNRVEENEEEEDMEQDINEEEETREMQIKMDMREDASENENPKEAVHANISKKICMIT